ncbi:type II secretion system F family protein [Caldithrix abyssi]|uniref:Type II secretion system F domain-containing protein n=1 Tax=Caldithrix abyssi DSM 13497 TaxID=880073 RepID=H1XNJ8_CALAY|nr:type II secretion system F family protein [Caldithrix abyssi]APF19331.1 type IV pilus assembly protein PilC/MSHA biogenesis protein MshG [Caldithrix abyssi DSM 13497]EHO43236.1 Type II secretion system F domain-containing protein [Caldithrix abyssi DSM 13497]
MPNYKYKAYNAEGKLVESTMLASSEDEVTRQLDELNMVPVFIEPVESSKKTRKIRMNIKDDAVLHFTKQLSTMLRAGIPMLLALQTVKDQTKDENLKQVIETIRKDIEQGSKFSDALAQFPKIFSKIFINAIRVGEISGTLEDSLQYMHEYMEKDIKMRSSVKKALRYPMFVVIAIVAAFLIFVTTVIPNFIPMFEATGAQLPLPTRLLLGVYALLTKYGLITLFVMIVLSGTAIYYFRTPKGRYWLDEHILKLPVFGNFIRKVIIARFARLFYTMNRTGVNITETLEIIQTSLGNLFYNKVLASVADRILKGESIADALRKSGEFPDLLIDMVSIGEKSGSLDDMLLSVSNYYEEEVSDMVENMSSLIEPVMTIVLGGMILILALALIMPMLDMMNLM